MKSWGQTPQPNLLAPDSTHIGHCGTSGKAIWQRELAYRNYLQTGTMLDEHGNLQAFTAQPNFDPNLVVTCGRFKVYYEDLLIASQGGGNGGFADATVIGSQTLGEIRQNTMCSVLTYIQSTLDFNTLPQGEYLHLYIMQSYSMPVNPAPNTTKFLGRAYPTFTGVTPSSSGFFAGDMHEHLLGNDPDVNNYDTQIIVNFDKIFYSIIPLITETIDYWNYAAMPTATTGQDCYVFDLYSVLLHEVTHTLGWFSLMEDQGLASTTIGTNVFSMLDDEMYYGDIANPPLTTKLVVNMPPIINPSFNIIYPNNTPPLRTTRIWLHNQGIPYSQPVFSENTLILGSLLNHLNYNFYSGMNMAQFSPGYKENYVMGSTLTRGEWRRILTNSELRILNQDLNLPINNNYPDKNLLLTNTPPHRTNNNVPLQFRWDDPFSPGYLSNIEAAFEETYPINYSINNINTQLNPIACSLVIDMTLPQTLQNLHIADYNGDNLSIAPNSLYAIRGVSNPYSPNPNNHDALIINTSNNRIIFYPQPEYEGKATFAFRLWDGKEAGSTIIINIDVVNSTSYPFGHELIVNGDCEDGTEVRSVTEPYKPYSTFEEGNEGITHIAHTFNPYKMPTMGGRRMLSGNATLPDIDVHCLNAQSWGEYFCSYDLSNSNAGNAMGFYNPFPVPNIGQNYRYLGSVISPWATFPILKNPLIHCEQYHFSCDIAFSSNTPLNSNYEFVLEATDNPVGIYPNPYTVYQTEQIQGIVTTVNDISQNGQANWIHIEKTFVYCGANTDYFQIRLITPSTSDFYMDNLSLKREPRSPLNVQLINTSNVDCYALLKATTTDGCSPYTYSWLQYPNYSNNTISVPAGNSYTVIVTDACGVTGTTTITIPPPATSINTFFIPDNDANPTDGQIHWVTQPNNLPNGATLVVQGNLIMDYAQGTGFTLANHEVIMYPYPTSNGNVEGEITLNSGRIFTINNCDIHGCIQMWNGITLQDGLPNLNTSVIVTNSSHIEDARVGVKARNRSTVSADNSFFNKNGIGIAVNPLIGFSSTLKLAGCSFDCSNGLLNDPITNLTWSHEGINISKIAYSSLKPHNTYQNMPCGIYALNSTLSIVRDRFININVDHGAFYNNVSMDGTAIISRSVGGGSALRQTGWGSALTSTPTFSNCRRAVFVEGIGVANIKIENNLITNPIPSNTLAKNLRSGIEIRNTQCPDILVRYNSVMASEYGLSLQNYSIGTASLSSNYIQMQNTSSNNTQITSYTGIWVNMAKDASTVKVENNYIKTFAGIAYGICLQNCGDALTTATNGTIAQYNQIEMKGSNNGNASNRVGINLIGGEKVKIISNNGTNFFIPSPLPTPMNQPPGISGTTWQTAGIATPPQQTSANTMSRMPAAISVSGSPNALIQCNTIDNLPIGARFHNQSLGTDLSGNTFGRHSFGLYLSTSGVIGQQDSRGNQWTWAGTPTTGYAIGAWNRNGGTPPPIRINNGFLPITINDFPRVPIKQAALSMFPPYPVWFNSNTSVITFQCASIPPSPLNVSNITNDETQVAEGVDLSEEYAEEMLWTAQRELYDKLTENPSLLPEEGSVADFYEEKSQSNFADFQAVQAAQREVLGSDNPIVSANEILIGTYLAELAMTDSLIGTVTDSLVLDSLNNEIIAKKETITGLIAQNETLRTSEAVNKTNEINTILTDNAILTSNEVYEENEKSITQLYLETIAQEIYELTNEQQNILYSVANQCPLAGGRAVYQARSMWALFYEDIVYDDDSLCEVVNMSWRTTKPLPIQDGNISISPNPTDKELNFSFSKALAESANLSVYDSYGKMVEFVKIPAETTKYALNVSGLPQGIYFYQINTYKGKFVVIH